MMKFPMYGEKNMFQTTNQRVSTELDGLQLTGSTKVGASWGLWGNLGPLMTPQAKSALLDTAKWANRQTGEPPQASKK